MTTPISTSAPAHGLPPHGGIRVTVNGRSEEIHVSPRRTLLDALREDLHLTGTKEGCGVGTCGACTVLVDGKPVLSCLLLAVQTDGRTVETIESLGQDGKLDPLQQAFIHHDAFQCGFCTPGQIMALRGLLRETPQPSPELIRRAIEGNVCRCGAQLRIQDAALDVARGAETAGRTSPVGDVLAHARTGYAVGTGPRQPGGSPPLVGAS